MWIGATFLPGGARKRVAERARLGKKEAMPNPESPKRGAESAARAEAQVEGDSLVVRLGGTWRLRDKVPELGAIESSLGAATWVKSVLFTTSGLESWDSSLVLFIVNVRACAARRGVSSRLERLPSGVGEWIEKIESVPAQQTKAGGPHFVHDIGEWATDGADDLRRMLKFVGECILGLARVARRPHSFRWRDCIEQMRRSGAAALPIVGLISLLVGVTFAYVAAAQLRVFGADIFVADLVGLAVFREMGPMMAAIVLTGRTGAAFAAELGNMKAGEEIDALETFGVRANDFLVLPRLLALVLMMPPLALYADFLGIFGGMLVAQGVLDVAPVAFFTEMQTEVAMHDVASGLLKSFFFGLLVAFSGCYRGMRAARSATGVGDAATSSVVMGILLIVVADAIFAVIFNALGW